MTRNHAQSGNQYLETVAETNYFVYQDLVTEPGYDYSIELYYSGRPGYGSNANKINIYWEIQPLQSVMMRLILLILSGTYFLKLFKLQTLLLESR